VSRKSMKDYRTSNHQCIKDSMTVIIISSQSYKNGKCNEHIDKSDHNNPVTILM
jgi:hypothetical protein